MTGLWHLPQTVCVGGREYPIHADFRDILEILMYLDDREKPEFIRWQVALALFYEEPIPLALSREAMEAMSDFIRCGAPDTPGPRLLDWQQDAPAILSDINRVAGREVRSEKFLHWWTFLGWFHAIGQGQLSMLVAIRDKLRRGKKLEGWEQEFYRQNKSRVDLQTRLTEREQQEKDRLNRFLDTGSPDQGRKENGSSIT